MHMNYFTKERLGGNQSHFLLPHALHQVFMTYTCLLIMPKAFSASWEYVFLVSHVHTCIQKEGMLMQVQTSCEVSLRTTTHSCGRPGSTTTVSEFSSSHWRHQGWEGHSSWMVKHMHAHKLTHRCSLFKSGCYQPSCPGL